MSTNTPLSNIPPLGPPTGMMPGGGPSKFKPIDPLRVIRANWLWIAISLVIGLGIGAGTWYALDKYAAKYTSDAQFNVQANRIDMTSSGVSSNSPVRMAELEPLILREVRTIDSEPILRQILNKAAVQQTSWFEQFDNNLDDAYEDLDEHVINASHIRETPLFVVRATTSNKEDAQTILRALNDEYKRIKDLEVADRSAIALRAAQSRRDDAEQRIANITVQIKRFLETNPLDTLTEGSSEAAIRVRSLIVEQERLNQTLNSIQGSYDLLLERQKQGNFDPSDEERAQIEAGQEILSIDSQLLQLRVQRELLLEKFKPQHDAVRSIDRQILSFETEREKEFDTQARILFNAKLEQAANGVTLLSTEAQKTNAALAQWTVRRQDIVRLLQEYDTLQRALRQAEDERDEATNTIAELIVIQDNNARVVVEEYVPPQQAKKSFPPEPYVMIPGIGVLIMGLGTGLIFLRELVDQRIRSVQDVKMIPDAGLIGMIPSASQDRDSKSVDRVVEKQPAGLLAEAYRQARTAVLSKIDRRGYKTLMMVSAKPSSGVTTSAQNLAASCARSGRRVLLIDANFRRPGLAKLMSLSGQPGLAEALGGAQPIEEASSLVQASGVEGLSLLPAGDTRHTAGELFESPRFRDLLAKLEAEYDLLIIDAPPALLTSDAQLLTRHIDAMVLVCRARSDTRGMLQRLYRELDGQRADILGVLLNGVEASVGGYLKRNFREFHEYSGPERRGADRSRTHSNGTSHKQPPAPVAIDEDIADQDVFGDIDTDDSGEQDR
ncbi:MAG: polysaccharide biosynthesis tyrosine autokinase [Phycisphaeraceae bacterium]|nr:polysaccharide biosynthesis tyrosine autokinase [Phycisphaeraceae bacterium]